MNKKVQLSVQLDEEEIIRRAFSNLMERGDFNEYWSITVMAFTAFAVSLETEEICFLDGKPLTFESAVDEFISDLEIAREAAMQTLNEVNGDTHE
jgi:hypothetical protein